MALSNIRLEVMQTIEQQIDSFIEQYLIPVEQIWQPSDFLPNAQSDNFFESIQQIQEEAKELSYDFWVVLVGDMVTEEALPTYESWLMEVEGVQQGQEEEENGWSKWLRHWTGEENRHGDLLNKYLYLSGRVNMREVEITTQYLINDGFDPGTGRDPYKNFVYTSFQELATHISHKRVGKIAKQKDNKLLGKMCQMIAGDEMRHHVAYRAFVRKIFEIDPSEMMIAFRDMMKHKIMMPAQLIREAGGAVGTSFIDFGNAAQRLGVYTSMDYVQILEKLNKFWEIDKICDLNEQGEKARDYLLKLPTRLTRIAERMHFPEHERLFRWVNPEGMMV